jgi:hypothetical protein
LAKRSGTDVAVTEGEEINRMPSQGLIAALTSRVRNAFLDVPDLTMTQEQAQRLFRIDRATCQALFDRLVDSAVVTRRPDGAFVRFGPHAHSASRAA